MLKTVRQAMPLYLAGQLWLEMTWGAAAVREQMFKINWQLAGATKAQLS